MPPVIQYGRDGDAEVLAVPITIANNGSNTGTVLAMETGRQQPHGHRASRPKRKPSTAPSWASTRAHQLTRPPSRSFAPISVPGRASYTETVRFYPQGEYFPKLIDDKGDFNFTLKLLVASPPNPVLAREGSEPSPARAADVHAHVCPSSRTSTSKCGKGTISMHAPDWKPAAVAPK